MVISKSDYLRYRECKKNAWVKVHHPEIYKKFPPSDFDRLLMKSGYDVEYMARNLFPGGVYISRNSGDPVVKTHTLLHEKTPVIYQGLFEKDGFLAAADVLQYNVETKKYDLYEVKSKNKVDEKKNFHDAAFQSLLIENSGIELGRIYIVHLNKEYIRIGDLDVEKLLHMEDVTDSVQMFSEEVSIEMQQAKEYLSLEELPDGYCSCIYKGRSSHCTTFTYINKDVPEYSVHDISRITPKRLYDLIDGNKMRIEDVEIETITSKIQRNQIRAHKTGEIHIDTEAIKKELNALHFPLYFIDYETYNSPLPRYNNFAPHNHIPFQYALYILNTPDAEPKYLDFLHTDYTDPSVAFVTSLQEHIGDTGSIIVWHKSFEMTRNTELAQRIPDVKENIESINNRVYDLKDIFSKQYFVHPGFKGKTSIKNVLPVLVPGLSYKELEIQNGGSASEQWNRLMTGELMEEEKNQIIENLRTYCGLDSYAMYAIYMKLIALYK
jgi:hypothetical protein